MFIKSLWEFEIEINKITAAIQGKLGLLRRDYELRS